MFETISLAYTSGLVDNEMLESQFGGLIVRNYKYFELFIKHTKKRRDSLSWDPIIEAARIIEGKRAKIDTARTPAGLESR